MNSLAILEPAPRGALTLPELQTARNFALEALSASTRRAYRIGIRDFTAWCRARVLAPLPAGPETTAAYLAHLATKGLSVSTIGQRAAAIRYMHTLANHETPTGGGEVRATLSGIRRTIGTAPEKKTAATADIVKAMLAQCPDTLIGKRDRALLALGFAGAFRRSELVALGVADLTEVPDGLRVLVRRSKTDQEGQGQEISILRGVRICPVEAVQVWLTAGGITSGPVFRQVALGDRVFSEPWAPAWWRQSSSNGQSKPGSTRHSSVATHSGRAF